MEITSAHDGGRPLTTVMLAIMGVSDYQPVRYALDGKVSVLTRYAPLAIMDLMAQAGVAITHLRVLLTPEAVERHWDHLVTEAASSMPGVRCEPLPIPHGRTEGELWAIFQAVCSAAEGVMNLDVTHGFRSTPLVTLAALRFVSETEGRPLPQVFYGAWEARDPQTNVAPMFNLSVLTQMDRWAAAIHDLERHLDPRVLTALVEEHRSELHMQGSDPRHLRHLGSSLRAGLPLEAGLAAARLQKSDFSSKLRAMAPPASRLAAGLDQTITDLVVPHVHYKKASIPLDSRELDRQRRVIDHALELFDVGTAYRLAREWLVNRVLLASGQGADWLDRSTREKAEAALFLYRRSRPEAAAAVSQLFDLRNSLSHGGFQEGELKPVRLRDDFQDAWRAVQAMDDAEFALASEASETGASPVVTIAFSRRTSAAGRAISAHAATRNPPSEIRFVPLPKAWPAAEPADSCRQRALDLERDICLGERSTVLVQMGGMTPYQEAVAHELAILVAKHRHRVLRVVPTALPPMGDRAKTLSWTCLELDPC